ncbi:L-lactate permease [Metabacillus arenae]|uniref:L-lactate permease n=1 Tax=Metabacillus arenae TaxID=2771434 RepID=A0A926NDV0_9BACI|nr:L-lactate permease [Metabacillus arenae]MBD1378598.1 L-lactate permease [Metabacillus arenae]
MSQSLLILLALLPIFIIFLFLVVLRWSAKRTMLLAYIMVLILALFVWKISISQVAASSVNGLITVFNILYIVFGAVLLLHTIRESGGLGLIRESVSTITKDRRIQVIIILWIFGAFLEGAAGFGSTGAVIGPLLMGLGFPAMAAAMVCMIFQSSAVSFGAVGTPILIGVSTGLGDGAIDKVNATIGGLSWDQYIHSIGIKVALIHGMVGVFIPLFMVVLLCRFFGKNKSFKEGLGAWKFALFGGVCLAVPYVLTAIFLGPEFPSIFGGLIGVIPAVIAAKKGWFMPKDTVWDFQGKSKWDEKWTGLIEIQEEEKTAPFSLFRAWIPYIIMAIVLFVTRLDYLPFASWLKILTVKFNNLFGTDISSSIDIFYSPGTVFIVVSILTYWIHGMRLQSYQKAIKSSSDIIIGAGAALIFAVPMVQVFLHSDGGAAEFASIPSVLADGFSVISGGEWAFVAPLIGAMGAFFAGSNTFSNMMFSFFQFEVAENVGINSSWVIALQSVGAAAGNIICVHNVVMASAAVGLIGREGEVLRKVLLPAAYYILFTGTVGYIILNGFGFNLGTIIGVAIIGTIVTFIVKNRSYHQKQHKSNNINM